MMSFAQFFKKMINVDFQNDDCNESEYIKLIESGALFRRTFLGINSKGFIIQNPLKRPGVYAGGKMGSGKSTSFKVSLVTRACTSGEVTFGVLVDVSKGMGDYKEIFPFKENFARATSVDDIKKLIPLTDLIAKELQARAKAFELIGNAASFEDYEKLYHYKLARYQMHLEQIKNGRNILKEEKCNPREIYDFLCKNDYKFINKEEVVIKIKNENGGFVDPFITFQHTHSNFSNLDMNPRDYLEWIGLNNILRLTKEQNEDIVNYSRGANTDISKLIITKQFVGVANIILAFEEFHDIPTSEIVNWQENVHVDGTIAKILSRTAKIGRSYGIEIFIATQGFGDIEFPSSLKKGVTNILLHRGDFPMTDGIKLDPAKLKQAGQFVMEDFEGRTPNMSDIVMGQLLRKYCKPCKGEMFGAQIEDYHRALDGSGVEGMISSYPLRPLLLSSSAFLTKDDIVGEALHPLVERILSLYDMKYEPLDNTTLNFRGIATKNGKKFAVFFYPQRKKYYEELNSKKIQQYIADMRIFGCEDAIVINFGKDTGQASFIGRQVKGYSADIDDLLRIASVFDNKEENIKSGLMNDFLSSTAFYGIAEEKKEESKPRQDKKRNLRDTISRISSDDDFEDFEDSE